MINFLSYYEDDYCYYHYYYYYYFYFLIIINKYLVLFIIQGRSIYRGDQYDLD